MKSITLLLTLIISLGTTIITTANASGSMGGNPACDSGAVNVGHAPCTDKLSPDNSK